MAVEDEPDTTERTDDDHLSDIPDGSGCTEIWEHLSASRDGEDEEE